MFFQRFYNESIAQASFLVACNADREAIVIDPTRDVDQYVDLAAQKGFRIVAVTETHIHADYVSGSRELASITGASLYLSREGGADWQYTYAKEPNVRLIGDGDEIKIGNIRLRAIHTPGHTPEHLSFLLIDGAATSEPVAMFSGDFIFAGDVGRPDLLETAAGFKNTMQQGAATLFGSLVKAKDLPEWLVLWPGHGSGSACGKALGGTPCTTLGYEKLVNESLRITTEEQFVHSILAGQPEPPKYFARMKRLNKEGPTFTRGKWNVSELRSLDDIQLIDVRSMDEFLQGSSKGAIWIPKGPSFSKWTGSLLDPERPVAILANGAEEGIQAAKYLVMIGIEHIAGWTRPDQSFVLPTATLPPPTAFVLDVRGGAEREEESIEGTSHIPLVYLSDRTRDLPVPLFVHCASGSRSVIAASYLQSRGLEATAILADFDDLKRNMQSSAAVGV